MDAGGATQPKKRKRKYRKSTHAILKEEKEGLLLEIETLTARLERLKTKTFGTREGEKEKDRQCKDKMVENRLLRRSVQDQQVQFTSVHALTNEYSLTDTEVGSSLHRFIHLDKGVNSRRAALTAMKDGVVTRGLHLLRRRKPQFHQPWRPMHDDHGFEASSGDYYACSFAVMPFKRFSTVQQAFAALITYFSNLEISRSENFGSVTIREDNDSFNADVAQNRLVTTTQSGHQMESNTVFFSKLVGEGSDIGQQRGNTDQLNALTPFKIVKIDTTNEESVADVARQLDGVAIDLLINNAGTGWLTEIVEPTKSMFVNVYEVNVVGPFLVTRALQPNLQLAAKLRGSASVVQISSLLGSITSNADEHANIFNGQYIYSSSKAALNMMTRSLARDLRDSKVAVVAVHPGYVDTELTGNLGHLKPADVAASVADVADNLTIADTGKFLNADPTYSSPELPW
ncbi:Short chain dehydrogenase [Phytophthora cinnamomi]|uniref:Short chain dehydrogenase n=1 Tax=Phytophthora cinnamomi TaxID=4785 RepID=UPI003559667F|nr:Short chain dehydrogenase [Phytophthora cinnamomi]